MTCLVTSIEIFQTDKVDVSLTWKIPDGSIKDLTGATISALAQHEVTREVVSVAGASVSDAANGITSFPVDGPDLSVGQWKYQITVTLGSDIQAAEYGVKVKPSIPSP